LIELEKNKKQRPIKSRYYQFLTSSEITKKYKKKTRNLKMKGKGGRVKLARKSKRGQRLIIKIKILR
jgi:hypothetical protein